MSKNKEENEEVIIDVQEVYSKTETFIEDNKNTLTGIVVGIAIIVGAYLSYTNFYLAPLQEEAQEEMFMAEKYFQNDSMNLAINGDGVHAGFLEIADSYSGTKAGNLAHYYLGIAFLRTGQYEAAINELNDFSSNDIMVGTMALGAQGDAYLELGDLKKAAAHYEDAADNSENGFSAPMYLLKAGKTHEILGNYNSALKCYNSIKSDFKSSAEFRDVEKLIARAESFVQ